MIKVRHRVQWPYLQNATCPWQRGRRPWQRQQLKPHKRGRCLHLRRSQRRRRRRLQQRETSALSAAVAPPSDKQLVAAATAPSAAGAGPSVAVATGPGRDGGYGDSATSGGGRMTGESEGRKGGCYWERQPTSLGGGGSNTDVVRVVRARYGCVARSQRRSVIISWPRVCGDFSSLPSETFCAQLSFLLRSSASNSTEKLRPCWNGTWAAIALHCPAGRDTLAPQPAWASCAERTSSARVPRLATMGVWSVAYSLRGLLGTMCGALAPWRVGPCCIARSTDAPGASHALWYSFWRKAALCASLLQCRFRHVLVCRWCGALFSSGPRTFPPSPVHHHVPLRPLSGPTLTGARSNNMWGTSDGGARSPKR